MSANNGPLATQANEIRDNAPTYGWVVWSKTIDAGIASRFEAATRARQI